MSRSPYRQGVSLVPASSKPLLLHRPLPDVKEGLGEYLTRLCSENHLDGSKALARRLGLSYGQLIEIGIENFREILCGRAKLISVKPGSIVDSDPRKKDHLLRVITLSRVCPYCFSEKYVASKSWSWPLTLACEQHGAWLLDRCPRCLEAISLLRRRQYACDCGYDYRSARMKQAEPWLTAFYEVFSPARLIQPQNEILVIESEQRAHRILKRLLAADNKELNKTLRKMSGEVTHLLRSNQIAGLRNMMLNWETGILRRIESIAESSIESARSVLRQIKRLDSSKMLTKVPVISESIEAKKKAIKLRKRLVDPQTSLIRSTSLITRLRDEATKIAVTKDAINSCSTLENDTESHSLDISEEESDRICCLYESSITLLEAAQRLDTNALNIRIFAKANVLNPVLFRSNQARLWRFSKDDIDSFLASLQQIACTFAKDIELPELKPLGMLPVRHDKGDPLESWARFARRVAFGEIPLLKLKTGNGLNSLAVRISDLPRSGRKPKKR